MRRVLLLVVIAVGALTTACGEELPTKSEFIAEVKQKGGEEFLKSMKEAGVSAGESTEIFEDFAGCVYDKIKNNEELLRAIANAEGSNSEEFDKAVTDKAASCVSSFQSAIADKVGIEPNLGG
jgi:hypothetical protein